MSDKPAGVPRRPAHVADAHATPGTVGLARSSRIAALITVICLALLIFCLIERQVRNALAPPRRDDDRPSRLPPQVQPWVESVSVR